MLKHIPTTLLSVALCLSSFAHAAPTEDTRCTGSPDSLDAPHAVTRTLWALKCYPELLGSMPGGTAMLRTSSGAAVQGYPTFAEIDASGNIINYWQAPTDEAAPCEVPRLHAFAGFCVAGCYTPDQRLLFSQGFLQIADAHSHARTDIVTLGKDSTLNHLTFAKGEIAAYSVDKEDKKQTILDIKTQDGGELKVTLNHPLLDSKGRMRAARTLKVGEKLVKLDGAPDAIVSIEKTDYVGKVYNVRPTSKDSKANIVVAQGFLNGSSYYQNEGVRQLNRTLLRVGNVIPTKTVQ